MNRFRPFSVTLHHDLAAILGLSFLLVLAVYLLPVQALRVILGGPFVLFFPGYTMVAALFPGKEDLEGLERLGLSLGLSVAILPLMGLLLNYTPIGITLLSTLVLGTVFVVACTVVAYYRRGQLPPDQRFALRLELDVAGWRQSGILDKSLTGALAVSIVAAVGTFLFVLAKPEVGERFSEFYVLDPYGGTTYYNERVLPGQLIRPIVGVINREHQEMDYRVRVVVGGEELQEVVGIHLAHDEEWEQNVVFALKEPGDQQRLEFLLYRDGQEEPYRSLHLWIDVAPIAEAPPTETPATPATPAPEPSPLVEPSPTVQMVATATPSTSPTPIPTAAAQLVHVVQPGETLSSIGRLYGVTYRSIMEANDLTDPGLIEVGQELIIPQGS